jgi:hypothetical protein
MGKCNLRIHRLTLAPRVSPGGPDNQVDDDEHLLASEFMHGATEISVASSCSRVWFVLTYMV